MRIRVFLVVGLFFLNQTFTVLHAQLLEEEVCNLPALGNAQSQWADFNQDGVLDLAFSGIAENGTPVFNVYENYGINDFQPGAMQLSAFHNDHFLIDDFNNDNQLDLVYTGQNSEGLAQSLIVYNNLSLNTSPVDLPFGLHSAQMSSIDIDSDGRRDILYMGKDQQGDLVTGLWLNTLSGFIETDLQLPQVYRGSWSVADFDGNGYEDFMMSGENDAGVYVTKIYMNDAHSQVNELGNTALSSLLIQKSKVVDFNQDGQLDVLISGRDAFFNPFIKLFINDEGLLTDAFASFPQLSSVMLETFDAENDGDPDVLLFGLNSGIYTGQLYLNDGLAAFNQEVSFDLAIASGTVSSTDVDGDGASDVFVSGFSNLDPESNVYRSMQLNTSTVNNLPPSLPSGLQASSKNDSVMLSWDPVTDDLTAAAALTYRLYVGSSTGSTDIYSPKSFLSSGKPLFEWQGNSVDTFKIMSKLEEGNYFWAVQAVDASLSASDFSAEESFIICNDPDLGPDLEICQFDAVELEIGTAQDVVNWFSKTSGLFLSSGNQFVTEVTGNDTIIVEVTKSFGCVLTDTINIEMLPLAVSGLPESEQKCVGEMLDYTLELPDHTINWYSSNRGLLSEDTASIAFEVIEDDTLVAEITHPNNCVVLDSIIVKAYELPPAVTKVDTLICESSLFEWSVDGTFQSVQWLSNKNGLLAEDVNEYSASYAESDSLFIMKTNANNCVMTDTVVITTRALPVVDLGPDQEICELDSAFISLPGDWDAVIWQSSQSGLINASENSFKWLVSENDTITVEATDDYGCVNYDTLMLTKLDRPVFDIGNDTILCYGENLMLHSLETAAEVNWYSRLEGLLEENSPNLNYHVEKTDTLIAEVFGNNGCVQYDSIIIQSVTPIQYEIGEDFSICRNQSVSIMIENLTDSINWYFGDSLSDYHGEHLQFEALNSATISIETINELGCIERDNLNLTVFDLPEMPLPQTEKRCEGDTVSFFLDMPNHQINWYSVNHGLLYSDMPAIDFVVFENDTLVAEIRNLNNCIITDSVVVTKFDLPDLVPQVDTTICEASYFEWAVEEGYQSVVWNSASQGFLVADTHQFGQVFNESDSIFITKTNANNCSITDTVLVNTRSLPLADLGANQEVCYGEFAEIELPGEWESLQWTSANEGFLTIEDASFQWLIEQNDTLMVAATDLFGCTNYDTLAVRKLDLPVFEIGADTTVCYGTNLLLSTGSGFSEVNWYGKQQGQILADSWFLEYEVNQTDTLWAEVLGFNGCVQYDTIIISSVEHTQYDIGPDLFACYGELVQLSIPDLADSINWYLGDSLINEHSRTLSFTAESSNVLWIETINTLGCLAYDSLELTVFPLPDIDLGGWRQACVGETLQLQAGKDFAQIEWVSSLFGPLGEDVSTLDYQVLENDSVFLYVADSKGCAQRDTLLIQANPLPRFSLGPDFNSCVGAGVTLTIDAPADSVRWFNEEGLVLSDTLSSLSFVVTKSQRWRAEQWTEEGCVFSDTIQITALPLPVFDAGDSLLICEGQALNLSPEGLKDDWNLQWSPAALFEDAQQANPLVNPGQDTWFVLQATSAQGCQFTDSVFVGIDAPVVLDPGKQRVICIGEQTKLGGSATASGSQFSYEYQWTPAASLDNAKVANPTASPTESTVYQLIVTTGGCRMDTAEVLIEVQLPPVVSITADTTIGAGDAIPLLATGGVFYTWMPERGLSDATLPNPTASPSRTTTYLVEVRDSLGCSSEEEVTIYVENQLFIPNLFTPNGDGQNDHFRLYGAGIKELEFQVFSGDGQLLYRTNSVEEALQRGWDGKHRGNEMPAGVYIWSLRGSYFDGRQLSFEGKNSGIINLLR